MGILQKEKTTGLHLSHSTVPTGLKMCSLDVLKIRNFLLKNHSEMAREKRKRGDTWCLPRKGKGLSNKENKEKGGNQGKRSSPLSWGGGNGEKLQSPGRKDYIAKGQRWKKGNILKGMSIALRNGTL